MKGQMYRPDNHPGVLVIVVVAAWLIYRWAV